MPLYSKKLPGPGVRPQHQDKSLVRSALTGVRSKVSPQPSSQKGWMIAEGADHALCKESYTIIVYEVLVSSELKPVIVNGRSVHL